MKILYLVAVFLMLGSNAFAEVKKAKDSSSAGFSMVKEEDLKNVTTGTIVDPNQNVHEKNVKIKHEILNSKPEYKFRDPAAENNKNKSGKNSGKFIKE